MYAFTATSRLHTSMQRPERGKYCLIACLFWLHVAFAMYTVCAPTCIGPPETMKVYTIVSIVVGWTAFMLAVVTTMVEPRMHRCKTLTAVIPILGIAFWGAWILQRSLAQLPWPTCSTSRVFIVGVSCAVQTTQVLMFLVNWILYVVLPDPEDARLPGRPLAVVVPV